MITTRRLMLSYGTEDNRGEALHYLRMEISGGYFRQVYIRKGHEDVTALKSLLESSLEVIFDLQIPKNGINPLKRIRIEHLVRKHNYSLSSAN